MLIFIILLELVIRSTVLPDDNRWRSLAPGMDIQILESGKSGSEGDSKVTVLRIDPDRWELLFAGISQAGNEPCKTAREWCKSRGLIAAINAGMFDSDYRTHVGYLRSKGHINNSHVNNYQSVIAFDPDKGEGLQQFRIFDLDDTGVTVKSILQDYSSAIQNLRLIKKPGINVWNQQDRKWSEAAIGEDSKGRILFIFSRSPFSMHDLNDILLKSGVGIVAAQHLEGGPEAQLYLHIGDTELELCGSYETSYNENNNNTSAFPIPNIIGLRPRLSAFK
jgi:uncharacterized protein YigE (DUF2233 family)